jgi:hypothetical protein
VLLYFCFCLFCRLRLGCWHWVVVAKQPYGSLMHHNGYYSNRPCPRAVDSSRIRFSCFGIYHALGDKSCGTTEGNQSVSGTQPGSLLLVYISFESVLVSINELQTTFVGKERARITRQSFIMIHTTVVESLGITHSSIMGIVIKTKLVATQQVETQYCSWDSAAY